MGIGELYEVPSCSPGSWVPSMPNQPILPTPPPIHAGGKNQTPANWLELLGANAVGEAGGGSVVTCSEPAKCGGANSLEVAERLNGIPFMKLLQMADAGNVVRNEIPFNFQFSPAAIGGEASVAYDISTSYHPLSVISFANERENGQHSGGTCADATRPDSSNAVESVNENDDPDKAGNLVAEPRNMRQPKQRRKKHRPKVVTEGKPRRTRKHEKSVLVGSQENPKVKRKYVRKNPHNKPPMTPPTKAALESVNEKAVKRTRRSSRRALNFEKECESRGVGLEAPGPGVPIDHHPVGSELWQPDAIKESETVHHKASNNTRAMGSKLLQPYAIKESDTEPPKARSNTGPEGRESILSENVQSLPSNKSSMCCSSSIFPIFPMRDLPGNSNRDSSDGIIQTDISGTNLTGVHYNNLQQYLMQMHFPVITKKRRTEKGSVSACMTSKIYDEMAYRDDSHGINPRASTSRSQPASKLGAEIHHNEELKAIKSVLILDQPAISTKKRSRGPTRARNLASLARLLKCSTVLSMDNDMQAIDMEALVTEIHTKPARKKQRKKPSKNPPCSILNGVQQCGELVSYPTMTVNSLGAPHCKWMPHIDSVAEQLKLLDINRESSMFQNGEPNALVLYNMQESNALVLYGRDGTIIPFVEKKRPRAKVDLDDETNRVWKLLMENINSEGIDGTDEAKVKWWEHERKVFLGRADSFIARMHLVQGDRRFSKWKGSVVDSVIGVFLTQNVSDHLSSSAFISLAARFPVKSEGNHNECYQGATSIAEIPTEYLSNPPDVVMSNQDIEFPPCSEGGSISAHENEQYEEDDINSNESSGDMAESDNSNKEQKLYSSVQVYSRRTKPMMIVSTDTSAMSEIITSQSSILPSYGSMDSSISQSTEDTSICIESNVKTCSMEKHMDVSSSVVVFEKVASRQYDIVSEDGRSKDSSNALEGKEHDYQRGNLIHEDFSKGSSNQSMNHSSSVKSLLTLDFGTSEIECSEISRAKSQSSDVPINKNEPVISEWSTQSTESIAEATMQNKMVPPFHEAPISDRREQNRSSEGQNMVFDYQGSSHKDPQNVELVADGRNEHSCQNVQSHSHQASELMGNKTEHGQCSHGQLNKVSTEVNTSTPKSKADRVKKEKKGTFDWDILRRQAEANGKKREKTTSTMDSVDWEAVRYAQVDEIASAIKERGMNNVLAERIQEFLNRLVTDHGSIDLEWLRDVPPDKAKEYLLSIRGLGLKSVECVRLLTLHHMAFPVDTNVGRIAVRLGWVPLQPLPESLQLHLLELYPVLESIQKYLWPRLCKLDQKTLYELHYQMITFGKVFCTKSKPNCNACPMRGDCRHFASAFASARLALPAPEDKSIVSAAESARPEETQATMVSQPLLALSHETNQSEDNELSHSSCQSIPNSGLRKCEPIIEEPASPEPEYTVLANDIEDDICEDPDEIPMIKLNIEAFTQNLQSYLQENMELADGEMSKALVALTPEVASIPVPKLKNVSRLRTEHQVYELPDSHPLLEELKLDRREPDDPCFYLLAIWTPGETADSIQPPETRCSYQENGRLCEEKECFSCNSVRETNSQMVRGTILIPCRTAMRGSFPLNGTYFQVNEVFADHDSSLNPINVPRALLWNLQRRTVYFGTSVTTIFRGLSTEGIQHCFWKGYVCVRGFDQKSRTPRPLMARLHFPASKLKAKSAD